MRTLSRVLQDHADSLLLSQNFVHFDDVRVLDLRKKNMFGIARLVLYAFDRKLLATLCAFTGSCQEDLSVLALPNLLDYGVF
jgi:hypothetical protein